MDPFRQHYDGGYDPSVFEYRGAEQAAFSVAMLIVAATLTLVVLKKSGFRAMVAVGRS